MKVDSPLSPTEEDVRLLNERIENDLNRKLERPISTTVTESPHDKLLDEFMAAQEKFGASLKRAKDLEAVKESAVTIRETANQFDDLALRFAWLGPMSDELRSRLLNRMKVREDAAMKNQGDREVLPPELVEIIRPAAEEYFEKSLAAFMKAGLYQEAQSE